MAIDERELDDSALVAAAQQGDRDAFAELFRRHYSTVRRVCARRFGNANDADEVAQAAFVRAFERLHQCEGERRFGAWVQVIAYNLGADARRHHARSLLTDEPVTGDAALGPNHCEDHVLQAEREAEVRELLDRLPPRQREVIIARDLEGQRPGEIAASLGLSLGAVDSLLLRARRRMAVAWTTGPEQGAATFPATATLAATAAVTSAPGPVSRVVIAVTRAVATVSYRMAATVGVVPGSSLSSRVGGAAVVGALALTPVIVQPPAALPATPPLVGVQHVTMPAVTRTRLVIPEVPVLKHVTGIPVANAIPKVSLPTASPAPGTQRAVLGAITSSHPPVVTATLATIVGTVSGLLKSLGLQRP